MISWVAIDTDIGDNPKLWELADSIGNSSGIPLECCVGLVTMLLGKVAVHAHDGDLSGVSDRLLEDWAKWRGTTGEFAIAFRRIFTSDGIITGWAKRQGKLIDHIEKVKEKDRVRKSIGNSVGKSTGIPGATVPDLTIHRTTTTKAAVPKKLADPRIDEVVAHYLKIHPSRRPGAKAASAIARALKSYEVAEICAAIDGNARDPWHREKGKHELDYVLRDNEKIDSFRLRPKPVLLYDPEVHGPEVDDTGVINPRLDWVTDPNHPERWEAQQVAWAARRVGA